MYGHNIVVRLHSFFCTLYTIIYFRFVCPICTPYVGYIKSKNFQKSKKKKPKKAKKAQFFKKAKKKAKNPKLSKKFGFFFLEN
jgi:hypothetical protein